MAINDRSSDDYRDRNGNDRDSQRRGSQQRYGMGEDWQRGQDFQGQQDFQQQRGGQGSLYGTREEGQYSGREYGGGGQQFQQGNQRYGSGGYGGGYGGGRYGEYGGGYGGEMGNWDDQGMRGMERQSGRESGRGYRDEYGSMGYGRQQQRMQGIEGMNASRYGVGRELGGGMNANQPRLGHYGGGVWNEDLGQSGSNPWNRDIENPRHRNWGGSMENQRSFSGRGPEGYNRSPDRIREEVCEILTDDHRIDASKLSVTVKEDGIVELSGEIDSRRAKRVIEDICDNVRGVKDVRNNLRINDEFHTSSQSGNGSMGSANGSTTRSTSKKS